MAEPGHAEPAHVDAGPVHVVATAGHVDHGKSTLIERLTGMDPDRLEEEKRRGLTIDLGFAWTTLPSGREIGFVDVPGHERFVRTMLAGVGPVRLTLFVVAADEGWKPQSEEHLAIVDVLGVDGAAVVLTKRDLVDPSRLAELERDVRARIEGTALDGAPIVSCSATTGDGLAEVISALEDMVAAAPRPRSDGRPRAFVDRVFTIAGAGTVVTGTLTDGSLSVGDEVEIVPSGVRARIRGLQTHKRRIQTARPVCRVAVNLAGVEREQVRRGHVLGRLGELRATDLLEARIRPVRGLRHALTARGAFTLHAGAAERGATLRVYGVERVPERGAFARIRLSQPVALAVFDRFALRESGRGETVAGGVVLDAAPPRRPGFRPEERLGARERSSIDRLPVLLVRERGVVADDEVQALAPTSVIEGASRLDDRWIADGLLHRVVRRVTGSLSDFHRDEPDAVGMPLERVRDAIEDELRSARAASRDARLADALLGELVRRGDVVREGTTIAMRGHRAAVREDEVERVTAAVSTGEPTPPTLTELRRSGLPAGAIDAALRAGALVRIAPDLVVTRSFVEVALAAVREAGPEGVTVSAIRQRLGTSRKYAVPLLEHLDRLGETRRSGDLRFARGV